MFFLAFSRQDSPRHSRDSADELPSQHCGLVQIDRHRRQSGPSIRYRLIQGDPVLNFWFSTKILFSSSTPDSNPMPSACTTTMALESMADLPYGLLIDTKPLGQKDRGDTFAGVDHEIHEQQPGPKWQLGIMQWRLRCHSELRRPHKGRVTTVRT